MKKICLIVDDEPIVRAYLKTVLQKADYLTHEAENAAQALRLVQELNGGLNLVVTDIKMPGVMDGVDLAHAVRNAFPAIPVILISGFDDDKLLRQRIGDFEFVRKPFTLATFLAAVAKVDRSLQDRRASP
jgi:two-component system cell cycle sensor histidine kinase/response regulator CckA